MKRIILFIAAIIFVFTTGCNSTESSTAVQYNDGDVIGSGSTHIYVSITDSVKQELIANLEIYTDKDNMFDALGEHGIIEGFDSDGSFNLTTVNGITTNYMDDGTHWVFYINGDISQTSLIDTPVENDMGYMFQIEK